MRSGHQKYRLFEFLRRCSIDLFLKTCVVMSFPEHEGPNGEANPLGAAKPCVMMSSVIFITFRIITRVSNCCEA